MNDLDELRRALQAPDPELRPLDLPTIMRAGVRVRRRRRLTIGAGSGLAVLMLLIGGGQAVRSLQQPGQHSPGAQPRASAPVSTTATSATTASARPPTVAPSATSGEQSRAPDVAGPLGTVVPTGLRAGTGTWVIHMTQVDVAGLPGTTIGIMASRLLPSGELEEAYASNETEGSDRSAGFHAVSAAQIVNDAAMPAFGYYVGPVSTITGRAGGRNVTARQAPWSEDPAVTMFWFDLSSVSPDTELTRLTAYDEQGRTLPTGNATPTVG